MDIWRVEAADPRRRLRLHAEMRLPSDAWLTWELSPSGDGGTLVVPDRLIPTTRCARPLLLAGRLALPPFRLPTLLDGITAESEQSGRRAP